MSDSPAVEVLDLIKRYGERPAVDGVTFTAPRGALLALLGPNGAGKTTTVEVCEGYRSADAGTVRVLGRDPHRAAGVLKPSVGVMLQSGGVYPAARAREMLRLVASFAAHPLDPDALLDQLGLSAVAGTPYRRLSGGQQRRLALGMAIVGRPEVVFLDEPTAGLDPQARRATWEIVATLRREGVAMVLSTHYLEEAERLADHVVILNRGRVVAAGAPAELTRGGTPRELLVRAEPGLDLTGLRRVLPPGRDPAEIAPGDYRIRGEIDPAIVAAVTSWYADQDVLIRGLDVSERSLEDVFVSLTGRELRS